VRLALLAKGLINSPNKQVRLDVARVRQSTIDERLGGLVDCERAALCVAGVEWVIRREGEQEDRADASTEHISTVPPHTSPADGQTDIGARPRKKRGRPAEIPDELKEKALAVQGITARARILYQNATPDTSTKEERIRHPQELPQKIYSHLRP
jgi:hypothetical protein